MSLMNYKFRLLDDYEVLFKDLVNQFFIFDLDYAFLVMITSDLANHPEEYGYRSSLIYQHENGMTYIPINWLHVTGWDSKEIDRVLRLMNHYFDEQLIDNEHLVAVNGVAVRNLFENLKEQQE